MKYMYSSTQQFIARFLVISLILQSCSSAINPLIPLQEEPVAHTQALTNQIDLQPLFDQALTAQGGHLVTFYEQAGQLKADVVINAPAGFSKSYNELDVVIERGTEVAILPHLHKNRQQGRIQVQSTQGGKPARVVICKAAGLMGGGKDKGKEKGEDEKLEEYDLLDIAQVDYIRGNFPYKEEDIELYAAPYRPSQPPQQCVQCYNKKLNMFSFEEMQQETVLMHVKKGQDGRTRISKTVEWPYLFHGQLDIEFSGEPYGGSGTLIGPQHILTAAHNVYSTEHREWAQRVVVRLGLNDAVAPYGAIKATRYYTFKRWINQGDPAYDLALVVLERPIGQMTGWCGLLAAADQVLLDRKVNITGYPGDKGFNQMWTMRHTLKEIFAENFLYEIDTYGGQSGSGIWLEQWGSPYVVGVHTLGENPLIPSGNSGVRLSFLKAKQVIEWIGETLSFHQRIPSLPSTSEAISEVRLETDIDKLAMQAREGDLHALIKLIDASRSQVYAQFILGTMYEEGHGVAKDVKRAFDLYNKAARQGYTKAQYKLGVMYYQVEEVGKDYAKAFKWYEKAAKQGHVEAQHRLGWMYEDGCGVDKDGRQAVEWFKRAAGQRFAPAQFSLGWMYANGRGVAKDEQKAVRWFKKAAKQRYAQAQYKLGLMYANGWGVTKDDNTAVEWFKKAAEQGDVAAQYNLGLMYANGRGIAKDEEKAVEWFKKAADKEDVAAQYNLGLMYANGRGIAKNEEKAVEWFKKAADKGDVAAQYNLGLMYANGCGVAKDEREAVKCFKEAAGQGDTAAKYNLGLMYANGWDDVAKNKREAFKWFKEAADQGDAAAKYNLGLMYANGWDDVAKDEREAFKWFKEAAGQGEPRAQAKVLEFK
jgi:TPR repeat protein/V8-like Glu-specific endopeptidase